MAGHDHPSWLIAKKKSPLPRRGVAAQDLEIEAEFVDGGGLGARDPRATRTGAAPSSPGMRTLFPSFAPLLVSGCFLFNGTPSTTAPTAAETGNGTEPTTSAAGEPAVAAGSPSAAEPVAAAPQGPVSVTLRNSCKQTVKVFFGDKPKFGSGTYSSLSSNSVTSHTFAVGDMMWIVDDAENGLSSTSVSANTREIEVLDGCSGLRVR